MIQNITPITNTSTIDEINSNFEAIQTAIVNKQLAFHYLNLYNLKGSVVADANEITREYNILNLNEALLIVVNPNDGISPAEEKWRSNITLYAGDYLVKTTAGPLRIPGPTTGYYIPAVNNNTKELTYTYTTIEPESGDETDPVNIQGASGGGYDKTFTCVAGGTTDDILTIADVQQIIQIYHSGILIDYPYTIIEGSTPSYFKVQLNPAWAGAIFTVRVR